MWRPTCVCGEREGVGRGGWERRWGADGLARLWREARFEAAIDGGAWGLRDCTYMCASIRFQILFGTAYCWHLSLHRPGITAICPSSPILPALCTPASQPASCTCLLLVSNPHLRSPLNPPTTTTLHTRHTRAAARGRKQRRLPATPGAPRARGQARRPQRAAHPAAAADAPHLHRLPHERGGAVGGVPASGRHVCCWECIARLVAEIGY